MASVLQEETHERNRSNVCVACYRKGKRSLSENEVKSVRSFVEYDLKNSSFPSGICNGCHLLLNKKVNGDDSIKFPDVDYEQMILPRFMRSSSNSSCSCQICYVATCSGKAACKLKKKLGRPPVVDSPVGTTIKVCAYCFARVQKGHPHSKVDCASRREKVYHL